MAENNYFINEDFFKKEKLNSFRYIKNKLLKDECDKCLIYKINDHFCEYKYNHNINKINYKLNIKGYINEAILNLQKYTNVS